MFIAYFRAFCALLVVFGTIAYVPIFGYLTDGRMDEVGWSITLVLVSSFAIGSLLGLLSYFVPLTRRRERLIRQSTGELLGIYLDPARVIPEMAPIIDDMISNAIRKETVQGDRRLMLKELISVRAKIAQGIDVDFMEREGRSIRTGEGEVHRDSCHLPGHTML